MNSKGRYNRQSARLAKRRAQEDFDAIVKVEEFSIPSDAHPAPDKCSVFQLDENVELRAYAQYEYKGMAVKFSVELFGRNPMGKDFEEFYAIDSSHGVIHYHTHIGTHRLAGRELAPMPAGDWNFVNDWYQKAQDKCFDIWKDEYDKWCGSFWT